MKINQRIGQPSRPRLWLLCVFFCVNGANGDDGVRVGEGGTGGLTRPARSHGTSAQTVAASGHRTANKLCPSVCESNCWVLMEYNLLSHSDTITWLSLFDKMLTLWIIVPTVCLFGVSLFCKELFALAQYHKLFYLDLLGLFESISRGHHTGQVRNGMCVVPASRGFETFVIILLAITQ